MENNAVETNKNKNLIIGVMACVIVLLIAALVYFLFIKKDKHEETVKPQNNQQTDNINNQANENTNKVITKSLIEGKPEGYNNNINKEIIKPIKQLNYNGKDKETIKIDDNLAVVFYKEPNEYTDPEYYPSTFDIVYKSQTLINDSNEKAYQIGFSTEKYPFEVYKLGEEYLIRAYSTVGQNEWDWLFYVHNDGRLERFEREDGALSPGTLSKIEYMTINSKSYYLLTIIGFSESDVPEDYDYTRYYYLNAN